MLNRKNIIKSTSEDPQINMWAQMCESLTEDELNESTSDEDILNTAFSTLLYFLCGEGAKVLKDDEWMNYLQNDINTAIQKGLFKPQFEDKQHIKKLGEIRFGKDEDDIEESDAEEETK